MSVTIHSTTLVGQLAGVNPLDYITWLLKNAAHLATAPEQYLPWKSPRDG